jgi:hypothetical protein
LKSFLENHPIWLPFTIAWLLPFKWLSWCLANLDKGGKSSHSNISGDMSLF